MRAFPAVLRGFFFHSLNRMSSPLHDTMEATKSTPLNATQREIPILGEVRKPTVVDWSLIAKCNDEIEALQLCVQLSRYKYHVLAKKLGIDCGHFTRIMGGQGHLPARKRTQLMSICGNIAPIQFDCLRFGLNIKEEDLDAAEQEAQRLAQEASQRLDKVRRARELRVAA